MLFRSASGGSGRYTYAITSMPAVGSLSGTRYVAGLAVGTDSITASDDCGNFAQVAVEVKAAFEVAPSRATVAPRASFRIRVTGTQGAPLFSAQGGSLPPTGRTPQARWRAPTWSSCATASRAIRRRWW